MLVRPPCTNSLPNRKYNVPANAVIPSIKGPKARKNDSPNLRSSFPRGMRPCVQRRPICLLASTTAKPYSTS